MLRWIFKNKLFILVSLAAISFLFLIECPVHGEEAYDFEVVHFIDANLERAIRDTLNKPIDDITTADMEGLTSLNAADMEIENLSGLEYALNLKELNLERNLISDLSPIQTLSSIEELGVGYNLIKDLSPLSNLKKLKLLDIRSNQIDDIFVLSALPLITGLALNYNNITDISPLSDLSNLAELQMNGNEISDISPLKNLTALYGIQAKNNRISDISMLNSLINLKWLVVDNNEITSIDVLQDLPSLKYLSIGGNKIEDYSVISNLTNLLDLFIPAGNIDDISLVEGLVNLQRLWLSENQIKDLAPLRNLTNLSFLILSDNEISDISVLGHLNNLDELWIENNFLDISEGSSAMVLIEQLIENGVAVYYIPQKELAKEQITVIVQTTGQGTTDPPAGEHVFDEGEVITLTAIAGNGYKFDNWTEDDGTVVSTSPSFTFTVNFNRTLIANFSAVSPPTTSGGGGGYVPYPTKQDQERAPKSEATLEMPTGTIVIDETAIARETITREDGKAIDTFTIKKEVSKQIIKAKEEGKTSIEIKIEPSAAPITAVSIPMDVLESAKGMGLKLSMPLTTLEIPQELVQALATAGQDLYIQVESGDAETVSRQMEDVAEASGAEVLGTPIVINTAIRGDTNVTISLSGMEFPRDPAERLTFLDALRVFVVHNDGEKKVIEGAITYDDEGNPIGISFWGDRFSTFAIIKLQERRATEPVFIKLTIGQLEAKVNEEVYILDAEPFIKPIVNRTLVPVRFISEVFGAKVEWIAEDRKVIIEEPEKSIDFTIDSDRATVNDHEIMLDCPVELVFPGRTLVPLRFVSEQLAAKVEYDQELLEISITR